MEQPKYLFLRDIWENDSYPLSKSTVHKLFWKRRKNGLDRYTISLGDKLMIREDHFREWLDSKKEIKE